MTSPYAPPRNAPSPAEPALGAALYATIFGMYIAEGLPAGIISHLLPAWLTEEGASLTTVGLMSAVSLPWSLKVLWAPLVDRLGHPKRWIVGAMGIVALCTALLPLGGLGLALGAIAIAITLASATQDLAIDGHSATLTPPHLQGRVNGIRVSAYRIGALLPSAALVLPALLGWTSTFFALALLCAFVAMGALALPAAAPAPSTTLSQWLSALKGWVLEHGFGGAILLFAWVTLFRLGDSALTPMVTPFWMKSGLSAAMVGMVSGVGGAFITMAGAMAGGELCTRLGLYRALFLVGAAQALSNLGYAAAAISPSNLSIVSASAVDSFCSGLGTAGFLAAMMRITGREQATTRLAALTALTMLTRTTAGLFSGVLADRVGFSGWFALTFVLSIPGLLLLPALKPRLR